MYKKTLQILKNSLIPDLMPDQDPVPEVPVDAHSVTNLLMVIVLLTEERPEPEMATRLALLVLDLPLWNS